MSDFLSVMTHGGLLVVCLLLIVTTEVIAERKHRRAEGGIIPQRRTTDDTVPVFLSEGGPVTSQEQADALGLGQAYRHLNDESRPQPEG